MFAHMNSTDLDAGHRDDLKLAVSKMLGAKRRAFQAAMALKYCAGSPGKPRRCSGGAAKRWSWAYMSSAPGWSA